MECKKLQEMRAELEEELQEHIKMSKCGNASPEIPGKIADMIKDLAQAGESIAKEKEIWAKMGPKEEKTHGAIYEQYMELLEENTPESTQKLEALREEMFTRFESMLINVWKRMQPMHRQKYMQKMSTIMSKLQSM